MTLIKNQQNVTSWVNLYSDMLYGFALKRTNNEENAKDLVQETFLSAWRNIENYNNQISVKTWLFAILKNKLIDYYRKAATNLTDELIKDDTEEYFDVNGHWVKSAYPLKWEKINLESKEFYSILKNGLKELKNVQATVFTMKYIDDMNSNEICKILNLTTANYWVIIHRAKIQLRAYLEKNWNNQ